jgi:hypothetical protein
MLWLDSLIDLGLVLGMLEPRDIDLIHSAICSKGKRKGRLLKTCSTTKDPMKFAAWAAMMSTVNVNNVGFMAMMFMGVEDKAVFKRIDAWTRLPDVTRALNFYGQGMCEFNLSGLDHTPMPADDFAHALQQSIDVFLAKRAYA